MKKSLSIIFEIWELEEQWKNLHDPQMNWYGNMTYRRLSYPEMERSVRISNKIKDLKKELKREIGWQQYIKFLIAPIRFTKKYGR